MTRRLRSLAANLLLSLGVTALFVVALEGLARFLEPPAGPAPETGYFPDWERWEGGFYRFGAGPIAWPPAPATNADGLRDAHHTLDALKGTQRVVFLGDSVTYGYGLERENAYPQRLQELLDQEGRRIEVFNAAAPGWSTRQQRIAYQRLMRKYRPDAVLIGICLNDVPELQNNSVRPPPWVLGLHRRSALFRRLVNARGREVESVEELFRRPDAPRVREAWERFFGELRALRDDVRADGASLGLLVFPYRFQLAPGAPAPAPQRRLADFAAGEHLGLLDLLPALRGPGEAGFIDYCHFSPRGTAAVAGAIPTSGLLPSRMALAGQRKAGGKAALIQALSDPDEAVQAEAMRALARYGAQARAATPALFAALDSAREPVRLEAARALWAAGPAPEDAPRLGALLAHDDPYVVAFAEESLYRLDAPALPVLDAALAHATPEVRKRAARLLARFGPGARASVPALARLLADDDRGVRRLAARALGSIGADARDATAVLAAASRDSDPQVRNAAAEALRRVHGE